MELKRQANADNEGLQKRIVDKKAKSQQLKKINGKKDRQLDEMQEHVDGADARENALKRKLRNATVESNEKGKLLLEMRQSITDLKKEFVESYEALQKQHAEEMVELHQFLALKGIHFDFLRGKKIELTNRSDALARQAKDMQAQVRAVQQEVLLIGQ